MIHNLDHATFTLQNGEMYSSRMNVSDQGIKNLKPIMRRLYRFFAHAECYHKEFFDEFEEEVHLCGRFHEFCKKYDIMPSSSLTIKL
jgi:hypothetical protein